MIESILEEKSNKFFDNWGTGIALARNHQPRTVDSEIVGGVTRASDVSKYDTAFLLACHFYPVRTNSRECDNTRPTVSEYSQNCVGAMVAIGIGGTSGGSAQVVNLIGVGLTAAGRVGNQPLTSGMQA